MTTANTTTASDTVRQRLCDVINASGVSPVWATVDNLAYFSELFVADLIAAQNDNTRITCSYCHEPLDRRRICRKREATGRYPNGKRCEQREQEK